MPLFSPLVVVGPTAVNPGMPLDQDGNPFTYIESGDTINVNITSTITSGKVISCLGVQADF